MQLFLIHLFLFTTTFSCRFAQEKSLHDLEDNNPLAANVNSYTEENSAPHPEQGDNAPVNVEQILRELSAERAKNRDLNHDSAGSRRTCLFHCHPRCNLASISPSKYLCYYVTEEINKFSWYVVTIRIIMYIWNSHIILSPSIHWH